VRMCTVRPDRFLRRPGRQSRAARADGTLPPTALSEQVTSWVAESFRRGGLNASPAARTGQDRRGDAGRGRQGIGTVVAP